MRLNIANNLGKTSKEIRVYVEAILPSLSSYSTELVVRVIGDHMVSCKWWPKLAELVERAQSLTQAIEYERQLRQARLDQPQELSDRQRVVNLVGIKKVRTALAKARRMS
jgi:hypothetical protein